MKTVRTKEIDGLEIVVGFDQLRIDPMATEEKIKEALESTEEFKALEEAIKKCSTVRPPDINPRTGRHDEADWERWDKDAKEADEQMKKCVAKLGAKRAECYHALKVFFAPRAGEIVHKLQDELEAKFNQLQKREQLTTDGMVIPDLRGLTFYKKGKGTKIEKLGAPKPKGAKELHELTEEEQLAVKLGEMDPAQRKQAKQAALDACASRWASQRAIWEVQGTDPAKALSDASEGCKKEQAKIERMYDV